MPTFWRPSEGKPKKRYNKNSNNFIWISCFWCFLLKYYFLGIPKLSMSFSQISKIFEIFGTFRPKGQKSSQSWWALNMLNLGIKIYCMANNILVNLTWKLLFRMSLGRRCYPAEQFLMVFQPILFCSIKNRKTISNTHY